MDRRELQWHIFVRDRAEQNHGGKPDPYQKTETKPALPVANPKVHDHAREHVGDNQRPNELDQNLAEAETTRKIWERRVAALRNQSLDPDMLDERARVLLHYSRKDDIIVFTPTR